MVLKVEDLKERRWLQLTKMLTGYRKLLGTLLKVGWTICVIIVLPNNGIGGPLYRSGESEVTSLWSVALLN